MTNPLTQVLNSLFFVLLYIEVKNFISKPNQGSYVRPVQAYSGLSLRSNSYPSSSIFSSQNNLKVEINNIWFGMVRLSVGLLHINSTVKFSVSIGEAKIDLFWYLKSTNLDINLHDNVKASS